MLRRVAERWIHASCLSMRKRGFSLAMHRWINTELRELVEADRVAKRCVVCRELGAELPGDVSTGDGLMCRAHALQWLQSESQSSAETPAEDLG